MKTSKSTALPSMHPMPVAISAACLLVMTSRLGQPNGALTSRPSKSVVRASRQPAKRCKMPHALALARNQPARRPNHQRPTHRPNLGWPRRRPRSIPLPLRLRLPVRLPVGSLSLIVSVTVLLVLASCAPTQTGFAPAESTFESGGLSREPSHPGSSRTGSSRTGLDPAHLTEQGRLLALLRLLIE